MNTATSGGTPWVQIKDDKSNTSWQGQVGQTGSPPGTTLVWANNQQLRLTLPTGLSDADLRERVLADAAVKKHLEGKELVKVVIAKGPLVSLVVQ